MVLRTPNDIPFEILMNPLTHTRQGNKVNSGKFQWLIRLLQSESTS